MIGMIQTAWATYPTAMSTLVALLVCLAFSGIGWAIGETINWVLSPAEPEKAPAKFGARGGNIIPGSGEVATPEEMSRDLKKAFSDTFKVRFHFEDPPTFKPRIAKPTDPKAFADNLYPTPKTPARDAYDAFPEDPWSGSFERWFVSKFGMGVEQERRWREHQVTRLKLRKAWTSEQRERHNRAAQKLRRCWDIVNDAAAGTPKEK